MMRRGAVDGAFVAGAWDALPFSLFRLNRNYPTVAASRRVTSVTAVFLRQSRSSAGAVGDSHRRPFPAPPHPFAARELGQGFLRLTEGLPFRRGPFLLPSRAAWVVADETISLSSRISHAGEPARPEACSSATLPRPSPAGIPRKPLRHPVEDRAAKTRHPGPACVRKSAAGIKLALRDILFHHDSRRCSGCSSTRQVKVCRPDPRCTRGHAIISTTSPAVGRRQRSHGGSCRGQSTRKPGAGAEPGGPGTAHPAPWRAGETWRDHGRPSGHGDAVQLSRAARGPP